MSIYTAVKKTLSKFFPQKSMYRYEYALRAIYALNYRGNAFECNMCGTHLRTFIPLGNDALCPRCGGLKRSRRLWQLLQETYITPNSKVLHFSPSRSLKRLLKQMPITYVTSDYAGEFEADQTFDITKIDVDSNTYDLIICYHILEHIENDQQAMNELFRVLKPGGHVLIQTPFKSGEIYENPAITSPDERTLHFGQHDHVRIYSVAGLKKRLTQSGFLVTERNFDEQHDNRYGFKLHETVLVANKNMA